MIVIIGTLLGRRDETDRIEPAGFLAAVASAAVASGSAVQVVTRIGDDDVGDAVLLALAGDGVGHVATLRDAGVRTALAVADAVDDLGDEREREDLDSAAGPTLEAADVALALRYLTDYRVIVIAHGVDIDLIHEASTAAAWAGASLILVTPPNTSIDAPIPADALVISADPDSEELAARLGRYAAALDREESADTAYAVLTEATTES